MCSFNECTFIAKVSTMEASVTPAIKIDLVANIAQAHLVKKNRSCSSRGRSPRNSSSRDYSPPNFSPPNYSLQTNFPEDILRWSTFNGFDNEKSEPSNR